ncbi:MAG TPA: hypothetical protein VGE42_03145, partial [Candidatus Dormibacteraeota bacterium]
AQPGPDPRHHPRSDCGSDADPHRGAHANPDRGAHAHPDAHHHPGSDPDARGHPNPNSNPDARATPSDALIRGRREGRATTAASARRWPAP